MKNNIISRFLAIILCLVFASTFIAPITTAFAVEEVTEITVFSLEDYIDLGDESSGRESVLDIFEKETGIKVNYYTFGTNEQMYNELQKKPEDCDLICTSEYLIMKMMREGYLRSFDTPESVKKDGSSYIKNVFKGLKIKDSKGEELAFMTEDESSSYAVGYMWGTLGMIYRLDTINEGELDSWTKLWDTKYKGRQTIKDSIRDSYIIALAYVYQDELLELKESYENGDISALEYNAKITEIFNRTDAESVDKAEESLVQLKMNMYGFEVDGGKTDILTGKIDINVAWSGDAVYALQQGLYDEETWEELPEEKQVHLGYAVPEEGANIWFDAYVMTKDAEYEASRKFLEFISRPDIAVLNMTETGYTSCVAGDEVFSYVLDTYDDGEGEGTDFDLSYFFGEGDYTLNVSDFSKQMFMAQYPTEEIINRCAVMQDFEGDGLNAINAAWKRIKLTTLTTAQMIIIIVAIVVLVTGATVYKFTKGKKA